jgi:GalNAc-alpha-(1->4)-GalNAc-alpha-(1->3)-diNAcBac-PP-undecaprenol alpha-1,4-N-acetyl-D-galactosaminyltransferase
MKKITFFISSLSGGGAEKVVSILVNNYIARGYQVDVCLLFDSTVTYQIDRRVRIIDFSTKGSVISRFFKLIYQVRKYLKNEKTDRIISFLTKVNIIILLASLGMNIGIYVSERNDPNKVANKLIEILARKCYQLSNCRKVIFQTQYQRSFYGESIRKKGVVIYNPIKVLAKRQSPKHRIVSVGRLAPQKNQELLIRGFEQVKKMYPEYTLTIYGEGKLRSSLTQLIQDLNLEDAVFLPGNKENIHQLIADAEMFVLTSDYEGLSNALLEAMEMGIPCISTNVSGIDEILINDKNSLLVPPKDEKALIMAIVKLIDNRSFAKKIGDGGKKTANQFNPSIICDAWFNTIKEDIG